MPDVLFPPAFFQPLPGTIGGAPEDVVITIPLAQFVLDGEVVHTAIRLDNFALPVVSFEQLAGRVFTFPVNPEPGYIDGSVYIRHVHNPVDVTSLRFGALEGVSLSCSFTGSVIFTHENSGFQDLPFQFTVSVHLASGGAA